MFQVVEKESIGVDWHQVRYNAAALSRFETKDKATEAAIVYLTDVNCNNALTAAEKRNASEAFMMTDKGVFLGVLDDKDWYLTHQKDIMGKDDRGDKIVKYAKNSIITERNHYELEGKTEVAVRVIPGT